MNKERKSSREGTRPVPVAESYDPLQKARDQARAFNEGWLKDGEAMPTIQRVGYGIVSLGFIFAGIFAGTGFWEDFQSRDTTCLFWGIAALFLVGLGVLGMKNVLRTSRAKN
jgi:hypothetical protein